MSKLKKINLDLNYDSLLSREERRKILGGYDGGGCSITEIATTSHDCDTKPNCGIDKDKSGGGVCCIAC